MKILIAASEAVPFVMTGGLAEVTGSLLKEYRKVSGTEVVLMLPLYPGLRERFELAETGIRLSVPVGTRRHEGRVWAFGSSVYFFECREFFERSELYGTSRGDYSDNAARFTFFSRAILDACMAMGFRPDVIHCNDWQTGLVPLYLKSLYKSGFFERTATVFTIHNLGYQGLFSASDLYLTGLGGEWFTPEGIEFYGKVNFLKAGLIGADSITTVSPTYAKEILTPEFGYGLEGVLKKRSDRLYGILNGIDTEEWNPRTDPNIAATYEPADIGGKDLCRKRLLEECLLSDDERLPVAAVVGRLSAQKGLDILVDSIEEIISKGARLIMLGKGDELFQRRVLEVAERHKGSVFVRIGYDVSFAHRIYAGSDIFIMPSRYEPCGLGQMIAMTYGTVPVARKTGGLVDTIVDYEPLREYGTGFLFEDYRAAALRECMKRALCFYAERKRWNPLVSNAMMKDFSWETSAARYLKLYAGTTEAAMRRG